MLHSIRPQDQPVNAPSPGRKGTTVAHELPRLREDHPAWHVWASSQGRLYATRPGWSALLRGASVTVDAATADRLSQAIAVAERDADPPADFVARRCYECWQ